MITLVFVYNKVPIPEWRGPFIRKPFELFLIRPARLRNPRNVAICVSRTLTFERMLKAVTRNTGCDEDALDELRSHYTASRMIEGYVPNPSNCKYIRMADNTSGYISFRLAFEDRE